MLSEHASRSTKTARPRRAAVPAERRDPIFTGLFVWLMVANGAFRMATTMLITLVPLYVFSRGGSAVQAGLTTTVFMFSAVLARPIAGRLVDARGRYTAMALGSVLFAVGVASTTTALPMALFLAVRVVQGVGFSLNGTAAMTLATDLIPEGRMAQGIGYLGLESTLAMVVGPWLVLLVARDLGYAAAFGVVFGFTLVAMGVRLPMRGRLRRLDRARRERTDVVPSGGTDVGGSSRSRRKVLERIVDRDALRPALIMFFVMFAAASTNTFLPSYILDKDISQAGLFFAASGCAVAVSRLLVGYLQRRAGPAWTIGSGLFLLTIALLGVFWSPDLGALVVAGVIYGSAIGVVQPGVTALAVLAARKERRGMASSTVFLAMDLSQAVGALMLGGVAGVFGTGSVFLVAAAVTGATLMVFVVARKAAFGVD